MGLTTYEKTYYFKVGNTNTPQKTISHLKCTVISGDADEVRVLSSGEWYKLIKICWTNCILLSLQSTVVGGPTAIAQ